MSAIIKAMGMVGVVIGVIVLAGVCYLIGNVLYALAVFAAAWVLVMTITYWYVVLPLIGFGIYMICKDA